MIKLKTLLENFVGDIENLEISLFSKYNDYLDSFGFYYDPLNDSICLSEIYIKPQFKNKGIGTKIMNEICKFADIKKLPIYLIPDSDDLQDSSMIRLKNFYKKFGFANNTNNNDYDIDAMIRMPK
jgi:GNAT superfamily N-acetyltransferase